MFPMSDRVPLIESERLALMDFYAKLKCVDPQLCPNITAGSACPSNLPRLQFSQVLLCAEGHVQRISVYPPLGDSPEETGRRIRALQEQQGPGGGVFSTMLSQLPQLELIYMWTYLVVRGDVEEFVASLPTTMRRITFGSPVLLRGQLPTFARLTGLVELAIAYSEISGTIPPAIGNLSRLSDLRLYRNRLTGTLPVLDNLSRLQNSGSFVRCEILEEGSEETNCISSCSNLPACCPGTTRSCMFAPEATTATTATTATSTTQPSITLPPSSGVSSLSQSLSPSQTMDAAIPQTEPTSSDGATIGIAVGVSAAVLLLVAAIALLLWRRKRASSPASSPPTGASAASNYSVVPSLPRTEYEIGRM
jgi:hypothetical protein